MTCTQLLVLLGVAAFAPAAPAFAAPPEPVLWLPLAHDTVPTAGKLDTQVKLTGPHRFLLLSGRSGYQPLSIKTTLSLPSRRLQAERGTVTLCVAALEDLGVATNRPAFADAQVAGQDYPLLMDAPSPRASRTSVFGWYWRSFLHPTMVAKFMKGTAGGGKADYGVTPYVPVEHLALHQYRWYHLALTWDKPASRLLVYVNGILAGVSASPFVAESPGDTLYVGNTAMVISDLMFFDRVLTPDEIVGEMAAIGVHPEPAIRRELQDLFTVRPRPPVNWQADTSWQMAYHSPLTDAKDTAAWVQQGSTEPAVRLKENQATPEGWLIQTADQIANETRVYFWSPQSFEGDVAVQFDFRPELDSGLALLVAQADGLQREDFIDDYPPRKSGGMGTIIGSTVRNYHWEFFRKAVDVRADLGTQLLVKNPWQRPLGMVTREPIEVGRWHRLLFVQEGGRLRCAMDGVWLLDVMDSPWINTGPVFSHGRIALRLMYRTRMRFRDLTVWSRFPVQTVPLKE